MVIDIRLQICFTALWVGTEVLMSSYRCNLQLHINKDDSQGVLVPPVRFSKYKYVATLCREVETVFIGMHCEFHAVEHGAWNEPTTFKIQWAACVEGADLVFKSHCSKI